MDFGLSFLGLNRRVPLAELKQALSERGIFVFEWDGSAPTIRHGWTGLVARLIEMYGYIKPETPESRRKVCRPLFRPEKARRRSRWRSRWLEARKISQLTQALESVKNSNRRRESTRARDSDEVQSARSCLAGSGRLATEKRTLEDQLIGSASQARASSPFRFG